MKLVAVTALALIIGCAGSSVINDRHAGLHELTVYNEAGSTVCEVHLFPEGEQNQGRNWLLSGAEIATGDSVAFWVQPGTYQVRLTGCARDRMQTSGFAPQVIMNRSGIVVLFREDDTRSVQAAGALAHEHQNSTQIPAKLTVNKSP